MIEEEEIIYEPDFSIGKIRVTFKDGRELDYKLSNIANVKVIRQK